MHQTLYKVTTLHNIYWKFTTDDLDIISLESASHSMSLGCVIKDSIVLFRGNQGVYEACPAKTG